MFKKLRNKFLFINLGAILLVLLISFVSIFFITYKNVENEVISQLNQTLSQNEDNRNDRPIPIGENEEKDAQEELPPSISFWLEVDENMKITNKNNLHFDSIQTSTYKALVNEVSIDNETGFFSYNGSYWAYKVETSNSGYRIAFTDISNNVSTLTGMLSAFAIVAVVSSILALLFSRYFANRAIEPMKETFQKQKQFVSDASHELKTPLTIINTNVDLVLSNEDQSVASQKQWLTNIKNEVNRTSTLTNNLLYLSKMDATEFKDSERINISSQIEQCTLSLEAIAYEKQLTFETDIKEELYVKGSPTMINQLIIILLDNAIKYSEENTKIEVILGNSSKHVNLQIINQSKTIPSEKLEHLFERFYRADDSRNSQSGGHGLGLAIASNIIDKHHGKITINSKDNKFIVEVKLPLSNSSNS
ncbi:sensor histidine kinase [Breznakia pachnodae]|uniref:histidine kinase n=1 Tax=Breznakia pachnodae TaxID=265178 RepID=A0ABU0DYS4_9FIRM|nr:HAMP domain-containing sensor histidine kinase [Breznakia pachnodae]MDQ0359659.1 signal transduction histidine kinase [Breznakia pachnodae]